MLFSIRTNTFVDIVCYIVIIFGLRVCASLVSATDKHKEAALGIIAKHRLSRYHFSPIMSAKTQLAEHLPFTTWGG